MSYWTALLMGILQGLTEFLPVSSSGHLALCATWVGLEIEPAEQLHLAIFLHFSTAMSTLLVFRKKIIGMLLSALGQGSSIDRRYLLYLLISALPAAAVGLLLKQEIKAFFGAQTSFVGVCLLLTAAMLAWGQWRSRSASPCSNEMGATPRLRVVLAMGLAQALALLPGVSRSGATIATGLSLRCPRVVAAEFSFLMALIPILGSTFLSIVELQTVAQVSWATLPIGPMMLGAVVAFVVGYWACLRMIAWVQKGKMYYFSIYCILLGLLAIGLSL